MENRRESELIIASIIGQNDQLLAEIQEGNHEFLKKMAEEHPRHYPVIEKTISELEALVRKHLADTQQRLTETLQEMDNLLPGGEDDSDRHPE